MNDEKLCPRCKDSVEDGAIYCGNCGYKLNASKNRKMVGNLALANGISVPAYAVPQTHHKQHWATMSLALSILAISFSYLVPILGLGLAIAALIMSTSSYRITHGWLRIIGIVASILAIMISIGFWVSAVIHNPKLSSTASQASKVTVSVITPCYKLTFLSLVNVNNPKGSCSLTADMGSKGDNSLDAINITASNVNNLNNKNFINYASNHLNNYLSNKRPSYLVTTSSGYYFANDPSYYVKAYSSYTNTSIILESVYVNNIKAINKDNYLVIRFINKGHSVNLNNIEKTWSWNN